MDDEVEDVEDSVWGPDSVVDDGGVVDMLSAVNDAAGIVLARRVSLTSR